ncbi:MAG: family 16 glycoside hydrolase [Planctomycetota bacterium]
MATLIFAAASLGHLSFAFCQESQSPSLESASSAKDSTTSTDPTAHWQPLQGSWKPCSFGGDGTVEMSDSLISLGIGDPLTGVRWIGDLHRQNYELSLQGRRTEGFDFFCAVTFPVGEETCSLVCGGWGGGVLGLSSIDGSDASSNETTQFKEFQNGQWYEIRIRVTDKRIQCWIDGDDWVDVERGDHEFDIRIEMDPALPLGIANYQCASEFRNLRYRQLESEP